jgi:hypothetical protein
VIPNIRFFNKNITSSKQYISAFYDNDMRKYIEEIGWYDQATKSGVMPSSERIRRFIQSQPQFTSDDNFDEKKYSAYLKEKELNEYELVEFYRRRLAIDHFRKAISFNEKAENYDVYKNSLHYSIFSVDNAIDSGLRVDEKELEEFFFRELQRNSSYMVDDEKLAIQYVEVSGGNLLSNREMTKLHDKLKGSSDIEKECKKVYGPEAKINMFFLPLGSKGKYHKLNFIFDKVYTKSDGETTLYGIVKKIEARSLKTSDKIDFDLLKKMYLGQMSYKIRFLKVAQELEKQKLYFITKTVLNTSEPEDIKKLRDKGLLFMKEKSSQMFKNSDKDIFLAELSEIQKGPRDNKISLTCNSMLSKTLSHDSFLQSVIEYWVFKSAENI